MVEDQMLDRAFGALADPTRRALLVALRDGDARITDLARPLPMTFAASLATGRARGRRPRPPRSSGPRALGVGGPLPFARRKGG